MNPAMMPSRFSCLMRDLKGVVNPAYVMGYIGQGMYRRSVRRTGLIGLGVLTVSIVGRGIGLLPSFTVGKAAIVTLVYGLVTMFGGLGLKMVSNILMSERLNIAQANNLNLLEDKKKSRLCVYLRQLYDAVFRFEAAARYSEEEIRREDRQIRENADEVMEKLKGCLSPENLRFLGVENLNDLVERMSACNPLKLRQLECSWEGFRITANYALTHPLPAALEAEIIGFDLTLLEDWLDGACFDATDVKLLEQYKANSVLARIKRQVRFNLQDRIWQSWKTSAHSFWFQNTFRSLAISVGAEIKRLNRRVGRGYFKAEHFLWIHPDLDRLVREEFGSDTFDELVRRRKRMIWKIFSHKCENAVELLHRIYRPRIQLAVDLRKRFDPEYFLGELDGQSYLSDLKKLSVSPRRIERERARVENQRQTDAHLGSFLTESPSLNAMNRLQRRAMRIAVHLNLSRLGDLLKAYYLASPAGSTGKTARPPGKAIRDLLSDIVSKETRFSSALVTLRTFWFLNWLELDEYCSQVKEIAYTE